MIDHRSARKIPMDRAMATTDKFDALSYFSQVSPAGRLEIAEMLARMVANEEQLAWLERTMIDRVGQWQGTAELRGVFCSRYPAADGIDGWCAVTPGFTADEMESLPAAPQAVYLPAPTDEPVGDLALQVTKTAKGMTK